MNEECRDSLKRFQFFSAHDLSCKPKVQQTNRDLIAYAFEQVQLFHRVGGATDAVRQNGKTDAAVARGQWNTNTVASLAELSRTYLPQGFCPLAFRFLQIKWLGKLAEIRPVQIWAGQI